MRRETRRCPSGGRTDVAPVLFRGIEKGGKTGGRHKNAEPVPYRLRDYPPLVVKREEERGYGGVHPLRTWR
jgi:hypothetical protein